MSVLSITRPWHYVLASAAALALAACGQKAKAPAAASSAAASAPASATTILNVSYDVMRDFYKDYNPLFVAHYQAQHPGVAITVQQSHGGSSKQALAVANGLQADVVTMNQSSDIELLQNKGLVVADWASALPNHAVPFTSTTVFLVRKGNPKGIKDWADLAAPGVALVATNPKSGGNGRYTFLAAYGDALKTHQGNEAAAQDYLRRLFANAVVLETGGRAATTTFVQRQIGDVLITFENEANMAAKSFGSDQFEIVYPRYSVAAENPVAVVNAVADKKGTTALAQEYLAYLWSDAGQNLAAELYLRPANADILAQHAARFPPVETFRPTEVFGPWPQIMQNFFADGGLFDQVSKR